MNDSTCPGGPRHKPFGVSRGSPRSQLRIYCTQCYIFNVVIEIMFYSIIFYNSFLFQNSTRVERCRAWTGVLAQIKRIISNAPAIQIITGQHAMVGFSRSYRDDVIKLMIEYSLIMQLYCFITGMYMFDLPNSKQKTDNEITDIMWMTKTMAS